MSNVLYECPEEGCGSRLFAAPGGTKLHCGRHPQTLFEQKEFYEGPNFEYVDPEQGRGSGATGVITPNVKNVKGVNKKVTVATTPDEKQLYLRKRYLALYGDKPDMRWGPKKLALLVANQEALLEAKTKAEFAERKGMLSLNDDGEEE